MSIVSINDLRSTRAFIFGKGRKSGTQDAVFIFKAIDEITEQKVDEKGNPVKDSSGRPVLVKRMIRLIPGESSIYADNQRKYEKEELDRRIKRFQVYDNVLNVSTTDVNTIEFLEKCNFNQNNVNRDPSKPVYFYEYEPDKLARKANEKIEEKAKAFAKVQSMTIDECRAYMLVLANDHRAATRVEGMSLEELRFELYRLAETKPHLFSQGLETEEMKNKFWIMRAASLDIIYINDQKTHMTWKNGDVILESVMGKSVIDRLAELAKVDKEYTRVLDDIKLNVKSQVEPASQEQAAYVNSKSLDENEIFLDKLISAGIIKKNGFWFLYEDKKWNKKDKVFEELFDDDEQFLVLRKKLKTALAEAK